jgi:hypothetical protein
MIRSASNAESNAMKEAARSVNGVPIRLTYERWYHIVENHDELVGSFHEVLETIERPQLIVRGNRGALKAARSLGKRRWLVVVYREVTRRDGFVITAYLLDRKPRGKLAWQR